MSSLSARLLISVSVLLLLFFGATIVVLDIAFREAAEQAQEDILDVPLYDTTDLHCELAAKTCLGEVIP